MSRMCFTLCAVTLLFAATEGLANSNSCTNDSKGNCQEQNSADVSSLLQSRVVSELDVEMNGESQLSEAPSAQAPTAPTSIKDLFHVKDWANKWEWENTDTLEVLSGPTDVSLNDKAKTQGRAWEVKLGASLFRISIENDIGLEVSQVAERLEQLPVLYRRALEIVSEDGKDGIAFYGSLFSIFPNISSQEYLNVIPMVNTGIICHEAGNVMQQRASSKATDILDRYAVAIANDDISVSSYGDLSPSLDLAEFAKYYAYCMGAVDCDLPVLRDESPERYSIWEEVLTRVQGEAPTQPPSTQAPTMAPTEVPTEAPTEAPPTKKECKMAFRQCKTASPLPKDRKAIKDRKKECKRSRKECNDQRNAQRVQDAPQLAQLGQ